MALITCPECGNQLSDKVMSCPKCGYILQQSTSPQQPKRFSQRKILILVCAVAVLLVSIYAGIRAFQLNDYEKLSLEACQQLKKNLINPNSFILFDDILVYPEHDVLVGSLPVYASSMGETRVAGQSDVYYHGKPPADATLTETTIDLGPILFITYAGENRYGGMGERTTAVFEGGTYLGEAGKLKKSIRVDHHLSSIELLYQELFPDCAKPYPLTGKMPSEVEATDFNPHDVAVFVDADKIIKALEK